MPQSLLAGMEEHNQIETPYVFGGMMDMKRGVILRRLSDWTIPPEQQHELHAELTRIMEKIKAGE